MNNYSILLISVWIILLPALAFSSSGTCEDDTIIPGNPGNSTIACTLPDEFSFTDWSLIYGDDFDNRPSKIKAFGDYVYLAGYMNLNGKIFATISRFDMLSGNLQWHYRMSFPSRISDFEYNTATEELIVVGAEGALTMGTSVVAADRSFICLINDEGTAVAQKFYDRPGKEGFTRIVRHHNPENPAFPYYVLGREKKTGSPTSVDIPTVLNMDKNLNVKWIRHYDAGIEVKAYHLLIPLDDGELLIGGSGSGFALGNGKGGVLIEINGTSGQYLGNVAYPANISLYDGIDLGTGEIAMVGHDITQDMGLIFTIDRNTYQVVDGERFPDVSLFTEIGIDAYGSLYTLGRKKVGPNHFPVLHKLSYTNVNGSYELEPLFSRYLYTGETAFDEPHLFVAPGQDAIFYADARSGNAGGFGSYDILIGSYGLEFTSNCAADFPQSNQAYGINNFSFPLTDPAQSKLPIPLFYPTKELEYSSNNFCNVLVCTADFDWSSECCTLNMIGTGTGVEPFTYQWDIDCDNTIDITGPITSISNLAPGTHQVCLTITDFAQCTSSIEKTVFIEDDTIPPAIICPADAVMTTDMGACTATINLPTPSATDDCTSLFNFEYSMNGATTGVTNGNAIALNTGITTITANTEDEKGNADSCSYTITVTDQEPPELLCPPPPPVTYVPSCEGGATVTFGEPTVSDNCTGLSIISPHLSGDFFPCGLTTITYTATDATGNQSSCSFPVQVDCQCAETEGDLLECTDVEGQYFFTTTLNILNDAGAGNCTIGLSSINPSASVNDTSVNITGTYPNFTISALVDIVHPPVPDSVLLEINLNCVCGNGNSDGCGITLNVPLPCCKDITVGLQEACRDDSTVVIPISGCDNLYDVEQMRWYIAEAPCPPDSWGEPFQVTNNCAPLQLSPQFHDGDICVYAEVDMGPAAGPCNTLSSNVSTIKLCGPVSCKLSDNQSYCWTGVPVTPDTIRLELNPDMPDCMYTIEWFDPEGNLIPSATGQRSYQPPALSFTLSDSTCNQSYAYTVQVSNICSVQSCTTTIRLDNDEAPAGIIKLLPPDLNPICYGGDAIFDYEHECGTGSGGWDWFIRPVSEPDYLPIQTNGSANPFYYTNRLYEDTWVKIEESNGVCPKDEIEYLLNVTEPMTINSFTAKHSPVCSPTAVDMKVNFSPAAPEGCTYTVNWYRGINLIHTSTHTGTTATHTYTPPTVAGLAGNFYCIIESECCPEKVKSNVEVLQRPLEVYAVGPCFRCNCDTILLFGLALNQVPEFTYEFSWYNNGVAIPGANDTILVVDPDWDGPFTFEVSYTDGLVDCTLSDTYVLRQCGSCILEDELNTISLDAVVYPMPTSGLINVEMERPVEFTLLEVFDAQGRSLLQLDHEPYRQHFTVDLSKLPTGNYYLRGISTDNEILLKRLIKQ